MPSQTIVCKLQDQDIDERIGYVLSETAPEDYVSLFGSRDKAASSIMKLARLNKNNFGRPFMHSCVEINDCFCSCDSDSNNINDNDKTGSCRKVLGMMAGYTQAEVVNSVWDYVEALGWWTGFCVFLKYFFLVLFGVWPKISCRSYNHFYIQDIAVHPDARGRGVGSKIVSFVKQYYSSHPELGVRSITLDVAHENPNARRLYERLGFEARLSWWDKLLDTLHCTRHWTCMEMNLFNDLEDDEAVTSFSPIPAEQLSLPRSTCGVSKLSKMER